MQDVKKRREHVVTSKFRKHISERKKRERGHETVSILSREKKENEIRRVTSMKACKRVEKRSEKHRLISCKAATSKSGENSASMFPQVL